MCSYNTLCICDGYPCSCPGPSHGIPACADHDLLTGILRDTWHSKAYVVSDAGAIKFTQTDHEYAASQPEAAADAIAAGADLALGGGYDAAGNPESFAALAEAVKLNLTNSSLIDRAFGRLVYARIKLGLLDAPGASIANPYTKIPPSAANSAENRMLAVRTAQEGVILLTNAKKVLPLKASEYENEGSLAVVGPNSDLIAYGNYAGHNDNNTTPVQGLRRLVPDLVWTKGCEIASNNTSGFPAAVKAAKKATVTIAVFGIDSSQEHETGTRKIITLPGVQEQLLEEISATGTKLILVLIGGSAMAVPNWQGRAAAIVIAGYGGEEAGTGLADVIFGAYNPAGRLPYTVPTGLEQLPPFENYQMDRGSCGQAACGRTYRYMDKPPLFHFGSGQSFTTFTTRKLHLGATRTVSTTECAVVNVTVEVSNTGHLDGDEVTQVYISRAFFRFVISWSRLRHIYTIESLLAGADATFRVPGNGTTSPAPPIALAAFARTHIGAGQRKQITLSLRPVRACAYIGSRLCVIDCPQWPALYEMNVKLGAEQKQHCQYLSISCLDVESTVWRRRA